jgi:site-specific DNA-methyltransferase (adenine-specific)
MPNVNLINGDCMEHMATLPDKAFDLAIVDPPYGIGWTDTINYKTEKQKKHQVKKRYKIWDVKKWDKNRPDREYFTELFRVSINQIIWGGNYFTDLLRPSKCWIVWDKQVDFTAVSNEIAWASFNKRIFIFSRCAGLDKGFLAKDGHIHPTQKPVALYQWLLKNYAKQGDRILDTHLGSGSSAIAADIMGFDFVGLEIDKDYYEAALDRFNRHKQQQVMVF